MSTPANHCIPVLRRIIPFAAILAAIIVTSGCVYRINIQQGNLLDADLVDQVEVGMTRTQVRFLLGTPLVNNPFDEDRWDYYYYFKSGKTRAVTTQHLVVFFDGEQVSSINRDYGAPIIEES